MTSSFTAPFWLPSPHFQTMWGTLTRRRDLVRYRRETAETPDGDELLLDHVDGESGQPRVVMLHGLEGSSYSVYIQGIAHRLWNRRWNITVMNFRSCAREPQSIREQIPNRGSRLYHSGETTDLDFILRLMKQRDPSASLFAFGASLGGNVLLKWFGEHPEERELVRAAATISVPYDLAAGARHLENLTGRLYTGGFLRSLRRKSEALSVRCAGQETGIDLTRARKARTFFEFDDAATGPLHKFTGAEDYYRRSSSLQFLDRIQVPTLLISAEDDPFLPRKVLDQVKQLASPSVSLMVTSTGGHLGFVGGSPLRPRYWAEERVAEWFEAHADGGRVPSECRGEMRSPSPRA